jgi:membrane fusion protein (multidrug efflux system)
MTETADVTEGTRAPSLRWILLAVAAGLLALAFVLWATAPEPAQTPAAGAAAAMVETLRVAVQPVQLRARLAGVLEPRRGVELFAESHGKVLEVGAEKLDRVEEGQLLARIDPILAEVGVERAEAGVARTGSQLELARLNLERRRSLFERDAASQAQLDEALNAERIAAASVREARAGRDEARDQLAKKTIAAPFDGVLRSFPVEVGEYLRDGELLGELLDLATVRISVGLSDRQVVAVRAGTEVDVEVEALPNERFPGRILRVGAASDPESRKFPVEVEVPNPDGRLLPGMVARVDLELGAETPATLIPRDATLDEFGLRYVWRIEQGPEGRVARRQRIEVREVPFRPRVFEVVSGLQPGDEIAVSGLRQLREGAPVAPRGGGSS